MSEIDIRLRELRAVLTETLPYELPLGFTNENLFLSELRIDELSDRQRNALMKLRHSNSGYTKPFMFKINRAMRSRNTISIIHPASQLKISKFYADFENSILQACARSTFSIRYPAATLKIHLNGSNTDARKRWRLGLPSQPMGEKIRNAYSPSYFSYRKYLLLDRFFGSNELVRLESKFALLRKLDVSKCFFNIYTHSISWAQKDKDFAKKNSNKYSFEQQFDELMQKANYNETAGILVGPEVSRIFAEVILQRVDINIEYLCNKRGFIEGRDYDIRRYIDDYYVFTNSADIQEGVHDIVEDCLEEYKLFLNTDKTEDLSRPFVTAISRVKHEVNKLCVELEAALACGLGGEVDEKLEALKRGRVVLDDLRYLGGSERGAFVSSFSGVFTALTKVVASLKKACSLTEMGESMRAELLGRVKLLIRILFYLLSVDFRVPPLIRASFIVREIGDLVKVLPESERRSAHAYMAYELNQLIVVNYRPDEIQLPLEITNAFILGLMIDPASFCVQRGAQQLIENIFVGTHRGYFAVVCALHYQISVKALDLEHAGIADDSERRVRFNSRIASEIIDNRFDACINCEDYLIFCDFLSCPAVDQQIRWSTFNKKLGGQPLGKDEFENLAGWFRHTNWRQSGDEFSLLIRRLQPVYFSG